MCLIIKCYTITRFGWPLYIKYVTCDVALLQQTKRNLRTTAIVLKILQRILQKICFEIRKSNSNFCVLTICGFFEEGPGANASNALRCNTALLVFSGYVLQLNNCNYVKFYKVSFGGGNVCAHSLTGTRLKTSK